MINAYNFIAKQLDNVLSVACCRMSQLLLLLSLHFGVAVAFWHVVVAVVVAARPTSNHLLGQNQNCIPVGNRIDWCQRCRQSWQKYHKSEKLKSSWKTENLITTRLSQLAPLQLDSSRVRSFENRVTFHKFAWFNNMTASHVNLTADSLAVVRVDWQKLKLDWSRKRYI